jgi:hypothetical protein
MDANMERLLRIEGPVCICQAVCCTDDVNFKVSYYRNLISFHLSQK